MFVLLRPNVCNKFVFIAAHTALRGTLWAVNLKSAKPCKFDKSTDKVYLIDKDKLQRLLMLRFCMLFLYVILTSKTEQLGKQKKSRKNSNCAAFFALQTLELFSDNKTHQISIDLKYENNKNQISDNFETEMRLSGKFLYLWPSKFLKKTGQASCNVSKIT